jgi:polysaccharide deacetylase 2 family uncharacterized protein YibQ
VDELSKPLGLTPRRRLPRRPLAIAAGAGIAVLAAGALVWLGLPKHSGPTATATIATPAAGSAIVPERTGAIVPAPSGGLTEVEPTGGLADINKVVIHDPSHPDAGALASLPRADLVEITTDGPLPKVGEDGMRPLDAYARPVDAAPGRIRVAIVVGGLGLDADGTRQAIATLPPDVTFAFAPYGDDLGREAADARGAGHELLLQVPLEPFNYPKTNPGPNTLTVAASPAENRSRLHWFMSRMTNYVGIVNYMGARFTGDPKALQPVIGDVGGRGLLYLDDGSSGLSKAGDVAAGAAAPYLRADVVLDADLSPDAIDKRLDQLLAVARQRGYAVATATAFPVSIERIAAFARDAANRGFVIVPVSALATARS